MELLEGGVGVVVDGLGEVEEGEDDAALGGEEVGVGER